MSLEFTDVINNTPAVNSSGHFYELMTSINAYIKKEYESGRLSGAQYAEVYLGMMQSALQQSIQYALQSSLVSEQLELVIAQTLSEGSQKLVLDAQKDLYAAQKQGFVDKTKIDSAKVVADTYAVQAGINGSAPSMFDPTAITSRLPE